MNAATWLLIAFCAVAGPTLFWALTRGGEKRARQERGWLGTGEVIDVREPTNVHVLDEFERARHREQSRRDGGDVA